MVSRGIANHDYTIYSLVPRGTTLTVSDNLRRTAVSFGDRSSELTLERENISIGVPDDRKLLTTSDLEDVQPDQDEN